MEIQRESYVLVARGDHWSLLYSGNLVEHVSTTFPALPDGLPPVIEGGSELGVAVGTLVYAELRDRVDWGIDGYAGCRRRRSCRGRRRLDLFHFFVFFRLVILG